MSQNKKEITPLITLTKATLESNNFHDKNIENKKQKILNNELMEYDKYVNITQEVTFPVLNIELTDCYLISSINIILGANSFYGIKNFLVLASQDGKNWITIQNMTYIFKRKFELNLNCQFSFKYFKIIFSSKKQYLNTKISIKYKKRKLLFMAARPDMTGVRLIALLNAMYLAKRYNEDFGFIWHGFTMRHLDKDSNEKKLIENGAINSPFELFSEDFISKYCYNDLISFDEFLDLGSGTKLVQSLKNDKLDELLHITPEKKWGWYINRFPYYKKFNDVDKKEYHNTIYQLWNEINFSEDAKKIIALANDDFEKIKNYCAFQFRLGDCIYNEFNIRFHFNGKGMYYDIAFEFIISEIKKGENFIITTDTPNAVLQIKKYIEELKKEDPDSKKYGNVISLEDFCDISKIPTTPFAKDFYELIILSKVRKIYASGKSAFSELARLIGKTKLISLTKFLGPEKCYQNVDSFAKNFAPDKYMQAYSAVYIYRCKEILHLSFEESKKYLELATFDVQDLPTLLHIYIELYLSYNKINECEKFLSDNCKDNNKDLFITENFTKAKVTAKLKIICFDKINSFDNFPEGSFLEKIKKIALK